MKTQPSSPLLHLVNLDNPENGESPQSMIVARLSSFIKQSGLSQKEVAARLSISQPHLSMLLAGKRRFTKLIARALADLTSISESEWVRLQAEADLVTDLQSAGYQGSEFQRGGILGHDRLTNLIQTGHLLIEYRERGGSPYDIGAVAAASIPLTIGRIEKENAPSKVVFKNHLQSLDPGESQIVVSEETVRISELFVGRIGLNPDSDLAIGGLLLSCPIHVPPGWDGMLRARILNIGSSELRWRPDELLSLEIQALTR